MNIVWAVFVIDYLVRLMLAADRGRWFLRHLLDLMIVVLPVLRPLRLLRLIALLGVLQRSAGTALRGRITAYTAGGVSLLVLLSSLAVLDAERGEPGTPITTFGQAVWWSLVTITTIGYGDLAPVTAVGRCAAVLLMIGGVALAGVVTATLASWIVSLVAEENAEQEAATRAQVDALQQQVAALSGRVELLLEAAEGNGRRRRPPALRPFWLFQLPGGASSRARRRRRAGEYVLTAVAGRRGCRGDGGARIVRRRVGRSSGRAPRQRPAAEPPVRGCCYPYYRCYCLLRRQKATAVTVRMSASAAAAAHHATSRRRTMMHRTTWTAAPRTAAIATGTAVGWARR